MNSLLKNYDDAFLFAYGPDMDQTIERMHRFCEASNIGPWSPICTPSDDIKDVKVAFAKLINYITENCLRSFLIVKSEDSILLGFKEMEQVQNLVESGAIAVWCLDEHVLLVNPEKAK